MRTPSLLLAYFRWSIIYKIYHFSQEAFLALFFENIPYYFKRGKKYRNGILIYIVMHLYKCIVIYKLFMM